MEDWAEIRRLHRSEGCQRPARGSVVDEVEPRIRELLGFGGGDHLGGVVADVRQPQPAQHRLQVIGQRRRDRHTGNGDLSGPGGPGGAHELTCPSRSVTPSAAQPAVPWVRLWFSLARCCGPLAPAPWWARIEARSASANRARTASSLATGAP